MAKKLSKQSTSGSTASTLSLANPSSSSSSPNLPPILVDALPLPRLVIFDLDYTLWPFWVDTHVYPPVKANASHTSVTDKIGEPFSFYADVPGILHGLCLAGCRIAVASRSAAPDLARDMLKLLHIPPVSAVFSSSADGKAAEGGGKSSSSGKKDKARKSIEFFDGGIEIHPGTKVVHFQAIEKRTGVAYSDMLFFDDEARNRDVTVNLGVMMKLVRDGMSWHELESGIKEWRKERGVRESSTNGQ